MALGDAIFESLLSMDRYASQRPRHTEEDLRFHDLYRQVETAMRILLMYEDQIQEVNYAAFVSRAKQMIQENDLRRHSRRVVRSLGWQSDSIHTNKPCFCRNSPDSRYGRNKRSGIIQ
jgi:hypothetical protein